MHGKVRRKVIEPRGKTEAEKEKKMQKKSRKNPRQSMRDGGRGGGRKSESARVRELNDNRTYPV